MYIRPIYNINTGQIDLYHAVVKAPRVYCQALGKTHTEAMTRALSEYFRKY